MSNNAGSDKGTEDKGAGGTPATFEAWLKEQPDDVKSLLDGHTTGLKSALESEREQRKTFEKQLRDAAKKLEEGSDARKSVEEMAGQLATLQQQSAFYDAAHAAGVSNLKLAFIAAQQADLFDKKGQVNFDEMKKQFPELFAAGAAKPPPSNGGQGTRSPMPGGKDMNAYIRKAAGRD